jgi:hypothetical protein
MQPGTTMSNTTYNAAAFKPTSTPLVSLLRELFQATPLYIFATAAKTAYLKQAQR